MIKENNYQTEAAGRSEDHSGSWNINFRKVVRQQIWEEVVFITPSSTYFSIQQMRELLKNWPMFATVFVKIKASPVWLKRIDTAEQLTDGARNKIPKGWSCKAECLGTGSRCSVRMNGKKTVILWLLWLVATNRDMCIFLNQHCCHGIANAQTRLTKSRHVACR